MEFGGRSLKGRDTEMQSVVSSPFTSSKDTWEGEIHAGTEDA